ncbi:endonuclease [Halosquirtibacter laminarini]|uniref:Endonuclease n=1 Tax=Halosquirtibacter laminarini TaxID=3374600 RepID=A0AC61NMR0_9BACT|nr:endonuclease [Prolixibacteraceae bacterium]
MIRTFTLFLLLFSVLTGFAQAPDGYYKDAEGKAGKELKVSLFNIIKDHHSLNYDDLYNAYKKTDAREDDPSKVLDMYTDIPGGTPKYTFTHINDTGSSEKAEGGSYNREHTVPQSWFNKATPMRTDLFHVYPSDTWVNNRRNNYPHADVAKATLTTSNGSKVGSCADEGFTGTVFEPIDEYKGDIARSYLYMVTRYNDRVSKWTTYSSAGAWVFTGKDYPSIKPWYIKVLLKWHNNDPVSAREIKRNNEVYKIQHNRNPFIDHPEYVESIWGVSRPYFESVTHQDQSFVSGKVSFNAKYQSKDGVKTLSVNWGETKENLDNEKEITPNETGNYSLDINKTAKCLFFQITLVDNKDKSIKSQVYEIGNSDLKPTVLFLDELNTDASSFTVYMKEGGKKPYYLYHDVLRFNGYKGKKPTDEWAVIKKIDISKVKNFIFSTDIKTRFTDKGNSKPFAIYYSYDYQDGTPEEHGTWKEMNLDLPVQNSNSWKKDIKSDVIETGTNKDLYIAFHYTTSGTGNGETSMWDIGRIEVTGDKKSTAVNDWKMNLMIQILPNPALDFISIQNRSDNKIVKMDIINIMGLQVSQQNISSENSRIDISELTPGLYLIKLHTYNGETIVKKIIKR